MTTLHPHLPRRPDRNRDEEANSAASASLRETLSTILADWNFGAFRPLQRESIAARLQGRDQLCIMGTGCGKSLCFQAPALGWHGQAQRRHALTVVVSPLIALMKDQVDRINRDRPRVPLLASSAPLAAMLYADTHPTDEQIWMTLAVNGQLPLLYVSPERFCHPRFFTWLTRTPLATMVIDEAHCVTDWGADHGADGAPPFRKAYQELGKHIAALRTTKPDLVVSAFTATATAPTRDAIVESLELRNPAVFVGDFDRPNLIYRVHDREDIDEQLRSFIEERADSSGIIYALTRAETERIAAMLRDRGFAADYYHGGPGDDNAAHRERVQNEFMIGDIDVIVATIAFGMGIDKPDVRFVLHAGMPSSLEVYHQEVGRAGRDGKPAECVLFYSPDDYEAWGQILWPGEGAPQGCSPGECPQFDRLEAVHEWCTEANTVINGSSYVGKCRRERLLAYFGQSYTDHCAACDVCLDLSRPGSPGRGSGGGA